MTKDSDSAVVSDVSEPQLDSIDQSIVALLSANARLSARAIAREVGMSPGTITDRTERLEKSNVIRGYHADINPSAFGYDLAAMIGLRVEHGRPLDDTIGALLQIAEIRSVQVVTGQWDLMVKLYAQNHRDLRRILLDEIWAIRGFRHSETMIVLRSSNRPVGYWLAGDADHEPSPHDQ